MTLSNPPKYRYPLNDQWDKDTYDLIKQLGASGNYPKIVGNSEEVNQFIITLIRTQKALHDWRAMLEDIVSQIRLNNEINSGELIVKYPPSSIGKDTPAWVTYHEDETVSKFIDELETRKVIFEGDDHDVSEFVIRFLLGQLGNDWEFTIFMIWEMLGSNIQISLRDINIELKNFDYSNLFCKQL